MRLMGTVVLVLAGSASCRAEVNCFRTPAMAAVQVGEQEGGGYRLDFTRRDEVGGRTWATVRSCSHPEWPAVVVATAGTVKPRLSGGKAVAEVRQPIMRGGTTVRVVQGDAMVRLEMAGVAQANAGVGERVLVRLLSAGDGAEERVAEAVVRSAYVVELAR